MKKVLVFLCAVMLVFGMVGSANANYTYGFSDMLDYWNVEGTSYGEFQTAGHFFDSVALTENDPLHYTHIITDDVDFVAAPTITSANLELDFTNDFADVVFTGLLKGLADTTEYISYAFDGNGWVLLGEVDNGAYSIVVDMALLQTDGKLVVDLAVSNMDNGNTIAWLDHSKLYGTAEVPEPATMLLLGLGLLGVAGVRRFKK